MAHAQIILHYQHGFLSGGHARKARLFVEDRGGSRDSWQINVRGCPLPKFAFEQNLPAALADQPMTRRKAEAAAVAIVFRGKKRLENSRFYLSAHAAAIID